MSTKHVTPPTGFSWSDKAEIARFTRIVKRDDSTDPSWGYECGACGSVFGHDAVEAERMTFWHGDMCAWVCEPCALRFEE